MAVSDGITESIFGLLGHPEEGPANPAWMRGGAAGGVTGPEASKSKSVFFISRQRKEVRGHVEWAGYLKTWRRERGRGIWGVRDTWSTGTEGSSLTWKREGEITQFSNSASFPTFSCPSSPFLLFSVCLQIQRYGCRVYPVCLCIMHILSIICIYGFIYTLLYYK